MTCTVSPGFTTFAAAWRLAKGALADVPELLSLPTIELTKYVVMSLTHLTS
jgi:hypothetical protein